VAYSEVRKLIAKLSNQPDMHAALGLADDGTVRGRFLELDLSSAFQPIFAIRTRQPAGYDAYARPRTANGEVISPWGLFAQAADDATLVRLDRLCRLVHTLNYFSQAQADLPLYLRVHGRLLAAITQDHGQAFRRMLEALGVPPSRIVLQLPSEAAHDVLLAGVILRNYRKAGFQAGIHANDVREAQSLLHLHAPDVLKLAPHAIASPETELPPLLKTAAERGSRVIFTCVEDDATLDRLTQVGADYVQGYLFGMPAPTLDAAQSGGPHRPAPAPGAASPPQA